MEIDDDHILTGAESFVIGLAPTFWTHIPLLIQHIQHQVHLIKGTHCLLLDVADVRPIATYGKVLPSSTLPKPLKFLPISKCTIVGTIVYMERKPNGCIMYVLDDGTGLIDIVNYVDDDFHTLPSLTGQKDHKDNIAVFEPGDLVRVFGSIQSVSIVQTPTQRQELIAMQVVAAVPNTVPGDSFLRRDFSTTCPIIAGTSTSREIHASLITSIAATSICCSRGKSNSVNREYEHWMDCVRFLQQQNEKSISGTLLSQSGSSSFQDLRLPTWNNALDVFQFLGSEILTKVVDRNTLLSANVAKDIDDDASDAWRVFGVHCLCTNTVCKRDLLYCHCIATPDNAFTMDPSYRYRDALLSKLIQAEADASASSFQRLKSIEEIRDDIINEIEVNEKCYQYLFQYSTIVTDEELNRIAQEQIHKARCNNMSTCVDSGIGHKSNQLIGDMHRLIRSTFRALRKDGIIFLVNADTDTYLLLSRTGVLEPYIRTVLALHKLSAETCARYNEAKPRPKYLDHVTRARLQFVRRCLVATSNDTIH
jgi:hypothetical protein